MMYPISWDDLYEFVYVLIVWGRTGVNNTINFLPSIIDLISKSWYVRYPAEWTKGSFDVFCSYFWAEVSNENMKMIYGRERKHSLGMPYVTMHIAFQAFYTFSNCCFFKITVC